jgi:tetratricopeptide (TPR) repeat protein
LQVKLHYFSGVVQRLKIPTSENYDSLINLAFAEQQKALALEEYAAYIYNELGILFMAKKQTDTAEKYFLKATGLATGWAIPWANLGYLYAVTGRNETGFNACNKADSLQPGLPCISNNFGLLSENNGNLLFAEEYYRRSIDLNSRHYLPFERLGYLYLNTARYALADSFFIEAEKRKMGLNFEAGVRNIWSGNPLYNVFPKWNESCPIPAKLDENDLMAFFYQGMTAYRNEDTNSAIRMLKKVISIDKQNPLAFHYLGIIFYEQKKWEEAELMFNFAIQFKLDSVSFVAYCDSVIKGANHVYPHTCFEDFFRKHYYYKMEDYYFIAFVYETWGHYAEAETMYESIRALEPDKIGGYVKSWRLLEKLGRYTEAEKRINEFRAFDAERTEKELNAFYRRAIDKFPDDNQDWAYRLGLLLYNRAKAPGFGNYLDRFVWFPKLNKEIFVDTSVLNLINEYDDYNVSDLSATSHGKIRNELKESISEDLKKHKQVVLLPGTNEKLYLEDKIYMPRQDGIGYLLKAAESISGKEIQADIQHKVGDIYVWAGSNKQAYPYYARSVELAPGNANTRLQLVDAGLAIYKNKATLVQLNYLFDSGQINFPKRMLLAEMTMYAGQFEKSKKILDEARQIHPFNHDTFAELNARIKLMANKPDEAIAAYKAYVTDSYPNGFDSEYVVDGTNAYYTIARLYASKQNSVQALIWLKKAINNGFNYTYILELDPLMSDLRKMSEWKRVVPKTMDTKLKQKGVLFDY